MYLFRNDKKPVGGDVGGGGLIYGEETIIRKVADHLSTQDGWLMTKNTDCHTHTPQVTPPKYPL